VASSQVKPRQKKMSNKNFQNFLQNMFFIRNSLMSFAKQVFQTDIKHSWFVLDEIHLIFFKEVWKKRGQTYTCMLAIKQEIIMVPFLNTFPFPFISLIFIVTWSMIELRTSHSPVTFQFSELLFSHLYSCIYHKKPINQLTVSLPDCVFIFLAAGSSVLLMECFLFLLPVNSCYHNNYRS